MKSEYEQSMASWGMCVNDCALDTYYVNAS